MYKGKKFKAIILAAGNGMRMQAITQKQYIKINGKPMVVYSLEVFEKSPIDEIILVVRAGEEEFCRKKIVEAYGFKKVKKIVAGGDERYHSTAHGLIAAEHCDYILIHDAARPCLTTDIILRCMDFVMETGACTTGIAAVDTINKVNQDMKVLETLDRNHLWIAQTPQVFKYGIISKAHKMLKEKEAGMKHQEKAAITDDVKIAKIFLGIDVHMVEGSYENIKVTTPIDLKIAKLFLDNRLH